VGYTAIPALTQLERQSETGVSPKDSVAGEQIHPVESVPMIQIPKIHSHKLVILAHPDLANSRINSAFADAIGALDTVAVRDLYALYPDHRIDVAAEQAVISGADEIVLQYPTHWYSVPGLMKQWLDDVLVRGWAYGTGAPGALAGKTLRVVTSTGGVASAYAPGEFHGWPYEEILIPLKATAKRLGMIWAEPLVVHGARDVTDAELAAITDRYLSLLSPSVPMLLAS
jgi:putative NADPH-quinone reductase